MQNYISFGISLPRDIIEEIDNERGDIPRSRYILRILQRGYILKKVRNRHKVEPTCQNCNNKADVFLEIVRLPVSGYYCEPCAIDIKLHGIAEEVILE